MTNFEKYMGELEDYHFGIVNSKLCRCCDISCKNCLLYAGDCNSCYNNRWEWLKSEYVEPKIDWAKIKVDTPIWVCCESVGQTGKHWLKRHFARYEDGVVYAWSNGYTSWSAENDMDVTSWNCAKLEV